MTACSRPMAFLFVVILYLQYGPLLVLTSPIPSDDLEHSLLRRFSLGADNPFSGPPSDFAFWFERFFPGSVMHDGSFQRGYGWTNRAILASAMVDRVYHISELE